MGVNTNQRLCNRFCRSINRRMATTIDTKPPPPPLSLREKIASLEPGQSLWTDDHNLRVVSVTTSKVRVAMEHRKFRIAEDDGGVRVWRIA